VGRGPRHRTDDIETKGYGDASTRAHETEGRLEARDAVHSGRDAYAAAAIRSQRRRCHPRGHRDAAATARSAAAEAMVPGVRAPRPTGKGATVKVSQEHHPARPEPIPGSRVLWRYVPGQHGTVGRKRPAGNADNVLQSNRNPAQEARIS